MEINTKNKLQSSLYKYEIMTAQQLATVHSYKKNTIYPYMTELNKQGVIGKIDVPVFGRGSKAYHLTGQAARQVAEDFNALSLFREKDWNTAPSGVINTLLANQFFCELIKATKNVADSGITDWKGGRTIQQAYLLGGETKLPPKMNGYASFYFKGELRPIYLNVLSGNESLSVLEDILISHKEMIQRERPGKEDEALFLFLCLGTIDKTVLKLWKSIVGDTKKNSLLAVANFEMLTQVGVFGSVWLTLGNSKFISLLDMPGIPYRKKGDRNFIGKQQIIRLQFNPVIQTLEFKTGDNLPQGLQGEQEVLEETNENIKKDVPANMTETGIDWNIN